MAEEGILEITQDMIDLGFAEDKGFDAAKLGTCIQCGTCSSSCPTYFAMDVPPRTRFISGAQLGVDLLDSDQTMLTLIRRMYVERQIEMPFPHNSAWRLDTDWDESGRATHVFNSPRYVDDRFASTYMIGEFVGPPRPGRPDAANGQRIELRWTFDVIDDQQ